MTRERLYAPWRMKYVTSEKKIACVFCSALNDDVAKDRENFLVYRGEGVFALMNIYPYNVGHLLVLPRRHVSTLSGMSKNAQMEMIMLTAYFTELLQKIINPNGFNVGLNIGKAAGAGLDSHLHMHIVPRWVGDSNFMPVIGETRVLPEELGITFDKFVSAIQSSPPPKP